MENFSEQKKKIELIQESIFPIICDIVRFCTERDIKYFLCAGTCLGAVRHQGFIPWDYDADIMFPRGDYEKFIHQYYFDPNKKYEIGALEIDPNWKRQYGRVWDKSTSFKKRNLIDNDIGAFVDIYPIDGFPKSKLSREIYIKHMRLLEILGYCTSKTLYHEQEKFVAFKKALHVLLKPVGWRFFANKMNNLARRYSYENSSFVGVGIAPGYGKREIMDRDVFAGDVKIPFNGIEMSVPVEYDKYLSNLYGDYMSVPKGAVESSYRQVDDWEMVFNKSSDLT